MKSEISKLLPFSRLAFVIPVYNHEKQAGRVVEKTVRLGFPVIAVDDGSTDSSPEMLHSIPGLTLIRHQENRGKGAALITGFTEAAKLADWAVTIDADGQHDPDEAISLVKAVPKGQRPLVVGCRSGMDYENVPWTSRWGMKFSNFWVWLSSGKWISDSQSGFRLYPLPETLNLEPKTRRFQYEVEILALAAWNGLQIIEAPVGVVYQPPQKQVSHFKPGLDFWRNTKTFARLILARVLIPHGLRVRKNLRS
jgi:glycosyltransferase involved in cell wall biosynthesis